VVERPYRNRPGCERDGPRLEFVIVEPGFVHFAKGLVELNDPISTGFPVAGQACATGDAPRLTNAKTTGARDAVTDLET
jgi:hypothetical protein